MLVINNLSQAWLEITVIPCLVVMSIFLGGRLATSSEINRRFLLLVVSTLLAACVEVIIKVFLRMNAGVVQRAAFFALININAYCLMAYVAAYTRSTNKRLIDINFLLLAVSLVMLFVFKENERIYVIFSPGFAVFFVAEGFVLQLIYQKYYTNGQFIVMNALFILLIDSFLIQYLFDVEIALVYTVATMMLVFTFFYLEAPTYRQLITAHKEIDEARLQAEASIQRATIANKAKSNFLASTSHEIRTPMNAILGINDMILAENPDTEARQASLSIKAAGEYLLALVNNILDISKIEAGKMDLYEADYHLWELLKDCEHDMTLRLAGKAGLKFVLDVDKDLPELLHGDVLRLKQVLLNLLSNSAKYTQHGSISLTVRGAKLSGTAILMKFVVQDTGIGMREEEAAVIYEPFERANILETRHIPGAGLGLTLVKNIVDIMSGRISLQTQYGKGTAFTVEIPQRVGAGEHMTVGEYEQFLSNQTVHEDTGPSTWHDARILVVDDTPVNLVVAKGMLKASEAEVDTCEGGEEALELMGKNHYDVVFLDHKMPGLDGVETLKKAKEFVKGTKFIALTANSGGNSRQEYISLGFDDYLPKPFKSDEMLRVLKTCLNS